MGQADRVNHEERAYAIDEAVREVPETVARIVLVLLDKDLLAPRRPNEERHGWGKGPDGEPNVSGHEIRAVVDQFFEHIDQGQESRGQQHGREQFFERQPFREEHHETARGHQGKTEELPGGQSLGEQHEGDGDCGDRRKPSHDGKRFRCFAPFQRQIIEKNTGEVDHARAKGQGQQADGRFLVAERDENHAQHAHAAQPEDVTEQILGTLALEQHFVPNQGSTDQTVADQGEENAVFDGVKHG